MVLLPGAPPLAGRADHRAGLGAERRPDAAPELDHVDGVDAVREGADLFPAGLAAAIEVAEAPVLARIVAGDDEPAADDTKGGNLVVVGRAFLDELAALRREVPDVDGSGIRRGTFVVAVAEADIEPPLEDLQRPGVPREGERIGCIGPGGRVAEDLDPRREVARLGESGDGDEQHARDEDRQPHPIYSAGSGAGRSMGRRRHQRCARRSKAR
jgi:hypothetical protein